MNKLKKYSYSLKKLIHEKLFLFILFFNSAQVFSQRGANNVLNSTSLKININGFRIGLEQKIFDRTTLQIEGLYLGKNLIKLNPMIKYYPSKFKKRLIYFGIGYYYKQQRNKFTDSVRISGTILYYSKKFEVSKYINALTLNYGFLFKKEIFKKPINFEFNLGLGFRLKKSNRNGLLNNEEINLKDAFILRPQAYQDTEGKFKTYPELNASITISLPLKK